MQMKRTGMSTTQWYAICSIALVCAFTLSAWGCAAETVSDGDVPKTPSPRVNASRRDAGRSDAKVSYDAGTADAVSRLEAGLDGGQDSADAEGQADAPLTPCSACVEKKCSVEESECMDRDDCSDLVTCINNCAAGNQKCVSSCVDRHSNGFEYLTLFKTCVAKNCSVFCS